LERESRGIATRAAHAIAIPATLCAGECFCSRLEMATKATYTESATKQAPTILSVKRSFFSRLPSSAITDNRYSNATAEVTSIKLSTPKPTREILPEIIPVVNAANPSKLFHPMVKYSRRLPRLAMIDKSALCGTTDSTLESWRPNRVLFSTGMAVATPSLCVQNSSFRPLVVNLRFTLVVRHLT
jgi:hypothetical protein